MDKIRRQALEKYARDVKDYDLSDSGIYLPKRNNIMDQALEARDLAEDALGNEVLKTTGVSIPGKGATKSQIENFFQDLAKEQYPDLPEMKLKIDNVKGLEGYYDPSSDLIGLDEQVVRKDPAKAVGSFLHEKGHRLDKKLGHTGSPIDNKAFRSIKSKLSVNTDPTDIYEMVNEASKHHAKIPGREGSYGLSNLKNILKGRALRGLGPLATGVGAAAALSSGDVAALSGVENIGEGSTKHLTEKDLQDIDTLKQIREEDQLKPSSFNKLRNILNKK